MSHLRPLRLLLLLPMFASACATGWQGARARVDDLTASVEHVRREAEVTCARTTEALEQLRTLTAADSGSKDVVALYARLVQSIDAAEQQAARFHDVVGPMKAAATCVFEQWERDCASITNEDLAQRGQTRLQRSKVRFAAIVTAADAAETTLATFHRALRDHTLFLGHDLNLESLREIRPELIFVATTEKEATSQLDTCMNAARAYVSAVTLPNGAPAGTSATASTDAPSKSAAVPARPAK